MHDGCEGARLMIGHLSDMKLEIRWTFDIKTCKHIINECFWHDYL
jgi:hypothetical protein